MQFSHAEYVEFRRAEAARLAALHALLEAELKTGLCQACGTPLHRDEMPGVMVVSYQCEHGPKAFDFQPALTEAQIKRLRMESR